MRFFEPFKWQGLPYRLGMIAFLLPLLFVNNAAAGSRTQPGEKEIRKYIASDAFEDFQADQRCHGNRQYRVYLIDNFDQVVNLVPEVMTSHGELLVRILRAGRDDIDVRVLNTTLSKGLAQVIHKLVQGGCADAVVSSIPGSNYTYDQISSLFSYRIRIGPENILYHRSALRRLLRQIALHGFPSVEWLQKIDVNSAKLRHDARMLAFIEALGRLAVPVILPYGNRDAKHKGRIKSVNLLSLASNAHVYSALNGEGQRVPGFPYSPLSSGDETAVFDIVECPHPLDPFKAVLDINADGRRDYTFFRTGRIAFLNAEGEIDFAPPVTPQNAFVDWRERIIRDPHCRINEQIVLTAGQYREMQRLCPASFEREVHKPYVWLNASGGEGVFEFRPACRTRGKISGTSVIPPNKLKELLPPKTARETPREREAKQQTVDG